MNRELFSTMVEDTLIGTAVSFLNPILLGPQVQHKLSYWERVRAVAISPFAALMALLVLFAVCGIVRPFELLVRRWLPVWITGRP